MLLLQLLQSPLVATSSAATAASCVATLLLCYSATVLGLPVALPARWQRLLPACDYHWPWGDHPSMLAAVAPAPHTSLHICHQAMPTQVQRLCFPVFKVACLNLAAHRHIIRGLHTTEWQQQRQQQQHNTLSTVKKAKPTKVAYCMHSYVLAGSMLLCEHTWCPPSRLAGSTDTNITLSTCQVPR